MGQAEKKKTVIRVSLIFVSILLLTIFYYCISHFNIEETRVFGATYMTMNNEFYTVVNDEIKAEVESRGNHLITLDPALDADKQVEQMKYLIEQKVNAIILNPVDWKAIKPGLEAAKKAKIPVIVVDAPVYDAALVTTTIVSDNYKAGVLCAQNMMSRLEKAKILVLTHKSAKSGRDRIQGFVDTIKNLEDYQIIDTINTEGQAERAFLKIQRLLRQNKEYDVVMSLNDPSALGAVAAFNKISSTKDLLVYGIDGSPDGKKMVAQHEFTGTVLQFPTKMAETTVTTLYQIMDGKKVEKEIIMDVEMADIENIKKYNITKWQ